MSKIDTHCRQLVLPAAIVLLLASVSPANAEIPGVRDHINRGNAFLSRHAYEEAIKEYEEAVSLDPANSIAKGNIVLAHNNWGINLANRKMYKEAMEQWQLALTLNPGYKDATRNMALLRATLERSGQLDLIGEGGDVVWEGDKQKKKEVTKSPASSNEPSSAKILTPGIKQSGGLQSYDMSTMDSGASTPSKPVERTQPSSNSTESSSSSPSSSFSSNQSGGSTMEDQLGQIESKVYGYRQANMPVIERLKKLETDAAGHTRTGTIKERIDFLRQTWGL